MTQLSDAKRDAILAAATRVFLAEGFSAVSMEAIALAAPVSKPTLYNYFPAKSALFAAVVANVCTRMTAAVDTAVRDNGDVRSDLKVIARAYVDIVYEPDCLALYRVVIAELKNFPELGQLAYDSGAIPIINGIAGYLRGVGQKSAVRFPRAEQSASMLIGMLSGDDYHRCLLGLSPTLEPRVRTRLVTAMVDSFLRAHRCDD